MAVILDKDIEARLEKVKRREWWPVALLAEALGRPKMYVYRMIDKKHFDVMVGGMVKNVTSSSVINYYMEQTEQDN